MTEAAGVDVVIAAAGSSWRMGGVDKMFASLGGKPLLAWSVDICQQCALVQQIVITLSDSNLELGRGLVKTRGWSKVIVCLGGAQRQDSVKEGMRWLRSCEWVMIHDGARPFLSQDLIHRGIEAARETGASVAAAPVKDTIKLADDAGFVKETLRRDRLWVAQTPQIFRFDIIRGAYEECLTDVTDDAMVVERLGCKVKLYRGSHQNIKVTTPEDLALAKVIARDG